MPRRKATWRPSLPQLAAARPYGGPVTPAAPFLAALASAAVPGLRPVSAQLVRDRPGERFTVAFVEDVEHRRWVVRLPVDAVTAAQQEGSLALLGLLARRVPFAVPAPEGHAVLKDGRRAMVYPRIEGRPPAFPAVPPGPGMASELGRAVAHLHNVDLRLFEEAAVPAYTAEECRRRHLVDVDRVAASGMVPVGLLARWERLLDEVPRWRFAPTPTHGRLDDGHILVSFAAGGDVSSGRVSGLLGWEDARVADPAEDLAALLADSGPQTADTVLEAYAMARAEQPDPHVEWRARLTAELRLAADLQVALSGKRRHAVAEAMHALRRLDATVRGADDPVAPTPPGSATQVARTGSLPNDRALPDDRA